MSSVCPPTLLSENFPLSLFSHADKRKTKEKLAQKKSAKSYFAMAVHGFYGIDVKRRQDALRR